MRESTLSTLRSRLRFDARDRHAADRSRSVRCTMPRRYLPHFILAPFLKRFHIREMNLNDECVCDYVCCILAHCDSHRPTAPPSYVDATPARVCNFCSTGEVVEDAVNGMDVCTHCGAVASTLVQRQAYEHREDRTSVVEFKYASTGVDASTKEAYDRIDEVVTTVAFDAEKARGILDSFVKSSNIVDVPFACVVAAVVVCTHADAIERALSDFKTGEATATETMTFKCTRCGETTNSHRALRAHRCSRSYSRVGKIAYLNGI